MIHHVWSVFCTSSAIDRDTNQVSLFDVVEEIRAEIAAPEGAKISIPARFQLLTLWARGEANDAETQQTRVRLIAPGGVELLKSENDVDLREHSLRRVRLNLGGLPYVGNGRYRFLVERNAREDAWEIVADVPIQLDIKLTPLAEAQQVQEAP